MSWRILAAGAALVTFGMAIFVWKVLALEVPIFPTPQSDLWQIEIEIAARGDGRDGSIALQLPGSRPGQRVFGEHFSGGRLAFSVRGGADGREAVWRGRLEGVHRLSYRFRATLFPGGQSLPRGGIPRPPPGRTPTPQPWEESTPSSSCHRGTTSRDESGCSTPLPPTKSAYPRPAPRTRSRS